MCLKAPEKGIQVRGHWVQIFVKLKLKLFEKKQGKCTYILLMILFIVSKDNNILINVFI